MADNPLDGFVDPTSQPRSAGAPGAAPTIEGFADPTLGGLGKYAYGPGDASAFAAPPKPFNVLPLSEDAQGKVSFDMNAGLPGALMRAVSAPNDALQGKFDPMSEEGQGRAREAASFMTPANPAIRAGARAIPGDLMSTRRGPTPSAGELKTAAGKGYDAARDSGAEYPGATVGAMADSATTGLQTEGILAELAPQTHAILGKLQNPPDGAVVTIASLDAARKALNRVAGNFGNPTEQEAARRVIRRIDELIDSGGAGAGVRGDGAIPVWGVAVQPPAAGGAGGADGAGAGGMAALDPAAIEAARLLKDARGNAAAGFRSERITGVEDAADLRASAANSGQNGGNALRQRLASLLLNDKQSRGFSEAELDAIRQIVEGTATSNTLRRVSNLLGGGGGLGQTTIAALGAAGGATLGGAPGAGIGAVALPLAGAATRSGYNALVGRQVGKLDELVRQRSPLYQSQPLTANKSDLRAAILLRGLLGSPTTGLLGDYQP